MKKTTLIAAALLFLTFENGFADEYRCMLITGRIEQLVPDSTCTILKSKPRYFPDVTFIGSVIPDAQACFTSTFSATIGARRVSGTASTGLTVNELGQSTAASAIQLNVGAIRLGEIYTMDVIFDAENPAATKEVLTMVDGTRTFRYAHGHLEIFGNTLYSSAAVYGTLCTRGYQFWITGP